MMKYFYLIMGGVLLLASSCSKSRKNVDDSQQISDAIHVNFIEQPLRGSQFLKDCKVIFLSSEHDEGLIANVDRLLVGDDRYFVMDRRTNKLMAFDGHGEFIASTARYIGEGPDNYVRIIDAAIDNNTKKVYAHCDSPYCIMVFDMNLQLEKKISLDYYMEEIADDENQIYGIRARYDSDFGNELIALKKADLLAEPTVILECSKVVVGVGTIGKSLTSYGNGVNVCLPFDNVVYQISNREIVARYSLDFGVNGVDYSDIKDMSANQFFNSSYREKIWSIVNVYSSDSTLFFGCNRVYSFTLNRSTKNCSGFSAWRNDLMPYSVTRTFPVDGLDNAYAYLCRSEHVMDFISRVSEERLGADLKKALKGYEEEDNPLIFICEMK